MRIGLIIGLHDRGPAGGPPPRWEEIRAQVVAAERVGFDIAVFEDAMTFEGWGRWESMAISGGLAAATTKIELSHSVINAPLRRAAVVARAAETLDEISGGRYTLGIGAGNTPDDYREFAIPVDRKFSRFEETLAVVWSLLRTGKVDFDGEFETAHSIRFAPRGPRPTGPPIIVAGTGPRVLRMCVRYGDGWNWWGSATEPADGIPSILAELDRACAEQGREPTELRRTFDIYSYDILGLLGSEAPDHVMSGDPAAMAESIVALADLGIDEVRCDVTSRPGQRVAAAEAMAPVVEMVKAAA